MMKISIKKTLALLAVIVTLGVTTFTAPAEAYWVRGGYYGYRGYYHGGWYPYRYGYYGPVYYGPSVYVAPPAYSPAYYPYAAPYVYGGPVGVGVSFHVR